MKIPCFGHRKATVIWEDRDDGGSSSPASDLWHGATAGRARENEMATVRVPIVKAKGVIEVDTDSIPIDLYSYALMLGLKSILGGRGMGKLSTTGLSGEKLEAEKRKIMEVAQKNLQDLYDGKTRKTGGVAGEKVSEDRDVATEALRLAKIYVKAEMKRQGIKLKDVKAAEITKTAKEALAASPEILEEAKENVKAMRAKKSGIDLSKVVGKQMVDPELAKKNEEEREAIKAEKAAEREAKGLTPVPPKGRKARPEARA